MLQVSADQRGRLIMSTERLNLSSERIKDSRRTMLETEELGVSILQDLHQQRQSLLHAHNTVCCSMLGFLIYTNWQPLCFPVSDIDRLCCSNHSFLFLGSLYLQEEE